MATPKEENRLKALRLMDTEKLVEIGNHLFDSKKFNAAVQLYNVALEKDGDCMEAFAGRACAHNSLQKLFLSIEDSTKAIALGCDDASIYYNRSNAFWCLQDNQKAIDDATLALERQPRFPEALCCRGAAFNATTAWDNAIADFTDAIDIEPRYPIARCSRGIAYCQKREWVLAIQDLCIAVKEAPQYTLAANWLVRAKQHLVEAEKAAEDMMRSLVEEHAAEAVVDKTLGVGALSPNPKVKRKRRNRKKKIKSEISNEYQPLEQLGKTRTAGGAAGNGGSDTLLPASQPEFGPLNRSQEQLDIRQEKMCGIVSGGEHKSKTPTIKMQSKKSQVKQSLHADLRKIEVTAMVEAAITVGTAKALGSRMDGPKHKVSEQLCLAAATQMQNQTKNYLISQLKDEYISEFLTLNYAQS